MLERLRRIARHGVEPPRQLAVRGIVGGHISADGVFGTAVADDDLALVDARRHRD